MTSRLKHRRVSATDELITAKRRGKKCQ